MTKLLSRKFLLTAALLLGVSLLLVWGKIDAAGYERIVIWVTSAYFVGNVSAAAVDKAAAKKDKGV